MNRTVTIAPVQKSIRVEAAQARAFEVFTAGLGRWWPTTHGIGKKPMQKAVLEPRLGGRWYELSQDGSEADVGKVLIWEPPQRFVVSWNISRDWKPDATVGSEVEVRFIAEGPKTTLVELEHRKFERMGPAAGQSMRKDVDGGWPKILDYFKAGLEAAEAASGGKR